MKFYNEVAYNEKDKVLRDNEFLGLKDIVDNGTTYMNVGHVYRGEEDVCLKMFGEQDEECIKHNAIK
jgi:hypothetical protein